MASKNKQGGSILMMRKFSADYGLMPPDRKSNEISIYSAKVKKQSKDKK